MSLRDRLSRLDDQVLARVTGQQNEASPDGSSSTGATPAPPDGGSGDRAPAGDRPAEQPAPARPAPPTRQETRMTTERTPTAGAGDGLQQFLAIFFKVCSIVFLVLALLVALAILFTLTPANPDNSIVSASLSTGEQLAGPFKDLFTVDDPDKSIYANYSVAAGVYLVLAVVFSRLPTGR